jgi:hypothetical protein
MIFVSAIAYRPTLLSLPRDENAPQREQYIVQTEKFMMTIV